MVGTEGFEPVLCHFHRPAQTDPTQLNPRAGAASGDILKSSIARLD